MVRRPHMRESLLLVTSKTIQGLQLASRLLKMEILSTIPLQNTMELPLQRSICSGFPTKSGATLMTIHLTPLLLAPLFPSECQQSEILLSLHPFATISASTSMLEINGSSKYRKTSEPMLLHNTWILSRRQAQLCLTQIALPTLWKSEHRLTDLALS